MSISGSDPPTTSAPKPYTLDSTENQTRTHGSSSVLSSPRFGSSLLMKFAQPDFGFWSWPEPGVNGWVDYRRKALRVSKSMTWTEKGKRLVSFVSLPLQLGSS